MTDQVEVTENQEETPEVVEEAPPTEKIWHVTFKVGQISGGKEFTGNNLRFTDILDDFIGVPGCVLIQVVLTVDPEYYWRQSYVVSFTLPNSKSLLVGYMEVNRW